MYNEFDGPWGDGERDYDLEAKDAEVMAEAEREDEEACDHICTSNCRRDGCNCKCGEWHKENS